MKPNKQKQEYWKVPRIWEGGTAWIIGGGISLKIQAGVDPNEKNENVIFEQMNAFLRPKLQGKNIIGLNKAFKLGDWIDICYFGDNRFLDWYQAELKQFKRLIVSCAPRALDKKWIKTIRRDGNRGSELSLSRNDSSGWFGNTGASSINFAALLGAKTIILLGFDGDFNKENPQNNNWHSGYPQGSPGGFKDAARIYTGFNKSFIPVASSAVKLGIKIYNATPNTSIQCFEKIDFEGAVNEF